GACAIGMVFYTAFLPLIAPEARVGRISGYGWGLGYFGGLACMIVGLYAFIGFAPNPGWLGIGTEEGLHARSTNLLVAGWFLVFSMPMFLFVREERPPGGRIDLRGALREMRGTLRRVRRFREASRFLLARVIYNDGLVTIFAFGGIYAVGTFGFTLTEVLIFGIVINVAAGLGALGFGFLDDRVGGKATVLLSLAALGASVATAMLAPTRAWLWVAALGIGAFSGPNQSASRSLMARFIPPRRHSEFFGFFAFSGKITAFLGPLLFGAATELFGSQRAGVATVLVFFLVGAWLLRGVDERRGIEAASQGATGV
ncbi:MAG: MFS transporter, partial [Longimicrobiales bacterium]